MDRIYLEAKPIAGGAYFHLYLVRRPAPTSPDQVNDFAWRNSGTVLRGTAESPLVGVPLQTQEMRLDASLDAYLSAAQINERPMPFDITDIVGGIDNWSKLETTVGGINGSHYDYELPFFRSDTRDHISNSNATILTALNAVGVDIRALLSSINTVVPGAAPNPTLLGVAGNDHIVASSGLQSGITLLGRDDVNDVFAGTRFGDRFYGEQDAVPSKTFDV